MIATTDHFEQLDLPTNWPTSDSLSTASSTLYGSASGSTSSSSSHLYGNNGDILMTPLDLGDSTDFSQHMNKDPFMDFSSLESSASQPLSDLSGYNTAASNSPTVCSRHGNGARGVLDCYAAADAILATLHFRSAASPLSSHSQPPGTRSTVLYFDYVVRTAHIAVCKLQSLLRCRCASDAHMTLLFSSIISISLYWYRAAAGVTDQENVEHQRPSSNSSNSSSRLPSVDSDAPFLNVGMHAAVVLTVYADAPDAEDQEPMRRALIISKLRHVERVIDALAHVDANASNATDNLTDYAHSTAAESTLNKSLSGWLRGELRKTIVRIGEAYGGASAVAFSA
ncbi:hypothetical protein FH972_023525 [Carpinus fangiana]|uniref:Aflatoxin regulatory protein domain-containing protein n=1 Tax=Carpinus fangiana TaxID=176857 RepID=A0A5N6KVY1_9ROSI|nr:hypothetical protein FH972_023525 [Carpinus fangiana]